MLFPLQTVSLESGNSNSSTFSKTLSGGRERGEFPEFAGVKGCVHKRTFHQSSSRCFFPRGGVKESLRKHHVIHSGYTLFAALLTPLAPNALPRDEQEINAF